MFHEQPDLKAWPGAVNDLAQLLEQLKESQGLNDLERIQARVAKRDAERVWRRHDAGAGFRSDNENGDCQIRALVTARGLAFDAAYDLLYLLQGKYRTIGFSLHKFLDLEPEALGVVRRLAF